MSDPTLEEIERHMQRMSFTYGNTFSNPHVTWPMVVRPVVEELVTRKNEAEAEAARLREALEAARDSMLAVGRKRPGFVVLELARAVLAADAALQERDR